MRDAGRDVVVNPADIRFSFRMFQPASRTSGEAIADDGSVNVFPDQAESLIELRIIDLDPYGPVLSRRYSDLDKAGREPVPQPKHGHPNRVRAVCHASGRSDVIRP